MNKLPVIMKPLLKFGGDEACGMGIFLIHTPKASNAALVFSLTLSQLSYRGSGYDIRQSFCPSNMFNTGLVVS